MKNVNKRIVFWLLVSTSFLLSIASCKKANDGVSVGGETLQFSIKDIKLYGESILNKKKITVSATAQHKKLEIYVSNCKTYEVEASIGGKSYKKTSEHGKAVISIPDLPVEEKQLVIELKSTGFENKTIKVTVNKGTLAEFDLTTLNLWGKSILGQDKITVSPNATSKQLEILVSNCQAYTATALLDGTTYTGTTSSSDIIIDIPDIPTEERALTITLVASGFVEKTISVIVNKEDNKEPENTIPAPDVSVSFIRADDGIKIEIVEEDQEVITAKTQGAIKISSASVEMATLTIDNKPITLTYSKRIYFHKLDNIKDEQNVEVLITYDHYKKERRKFTIKKVEEGDVPLTILNAKVYFGGAIGKFTEHKKIAFDKNKEATTTLSGITYSAVKLDMNFNNILEKGEVLECKNNRSVPYISDPDFSKGKCAGYIVSNINQETGEETPFKTINGNVYTERLLVGYGTTEFKIKITAKDGKSETYTLKIENSNKNVYNNKYDGSLQVYNVYSARSLIEVEKNSLFLPYYNKGPNIKNSKWNEAGFDDFAYIDKLGLSIVKKYSKPFVFYYNLFDKDNDKCQFKQRISKEYDRLTYVLTQMDPMGKCMDGCIAFENTLPIALFPLFYNKPIRKITKPVVNYQLKLRNNLKFKWDGEDIDAEDIFGFIFNYRIQTRYYEENNKNSGEKPLPIAMHQKVCLWENAKVKAEWSPFLSGATGSDKDVFIFAPKFNRADEVIDSIKHKIEIKSDNDDTYTVVRYLNNVTPEKNQNGEYVLGTIAGYETVHEFIKGKIYKVTVTVKYKDATIEDEKFTYLLDYKTEQSSPAEGPELLGVNSGFTNSESQLFGLPIQFNRLELNKPAKMNMLDIKH